jgi:hypothetical protein
VTIYGKSKGGKPATDHKGTTWSSFTAMCRGWGKPPSTVRARLAWTSLETALTASRGRGGVHTVDASGRAWRSAKAAARANGVTVDAAESRLAAGWDRTRAVSQPVREKRKGPVRDHKGTWYPTRSAMCAAYGITRACLDYRLDVGRLSLRAALTAPTRAAA